MKSLPVLVYHRVNNRNEDITEKQFENQMSYLAEKGYRTVFLKDWISGNVTDAEKTIAITFDDGYLDNWVYAYPILKKYGLKATIFVITSRCLDHVDTYRLNLEDVWSGKNQQQDLPRIASHLEANYKRALKGIRSADFLTWKEMREMEASGVIDIQSHTHYHRDFFASKHIVDFNHGQYFGLAWATDGDTRTGIPIYYRKSAMACLRYFDDKDLRDYLADYVKDKEYLLKKTMDYKKDLLERVKQFRKEYGDKGFFESPTDQKNRIAKELNESKNLIEKKLKKKCDIICWPWGEYSSFSIQIAKNLGFKGAVTFSPGLNLPSQSPYFMRRVPPGSSLEEFVKTITIFSNTSQALKKIIIDQLSSKTKKIKRRWKEGELFRSLQRRLLNLKSQYY